MMAAQLPPLRKRIEAFRRKVCASKTCIISRMKYDSESALKFFLKVIAKDVEHAEWVAAQLCMMKAGAKQGAWLNTKRDQRRRYVLQLRRCLENPSEPEQFFIEPPMRGI